VRGASSADLVVELKKTRSTFEAPWKGLARA
jgi:hypothetical protein